MDTQHLQLAASETLVSPCIGLCKIDDETGYCEGCMRTRDEIASWIGMSKAERQVVWSWLLGRASRN